MRRSRVVCGWGACLALSWGPVRAEVLASSPPLLRTVERVPLGCVPERGPAEDPAPVRLAQAPASPGTSAPSTPAPAAPGTAPTPPSTAPPAPVPGMFDEAARLSQVSSLAGFGAPEMF